MAGATIDHLISTTVFIAAILLFVGLFSQTIQSAVLYQQHRHVSLKASDLIDSILLSPGYPYSWGITNENLSLFGLQKPGANGYTISSFALMRLTSLDNPVEYPRDSGEYYNNVSAGTGGYLFIPIGDCVTYETASMLLGINGTYGFQLSVKPILEVLTSVHQSNPLILKVQVKGPGSSLGGAVLSYYMFHAYKTTSVTMLTGNTVADAAGVAYLDFPLDGEKASFTIVICAELGGLRGFGRFSQAIFTQGAGVMPFVVDYEKGRIFLAHSWDVQDQGTPVPNYDFNATFFLLNEGGEFEETPIENSTGGLNYGSKNYEVTHLPIDNPGFLLITYRSGNEVGMNVMPWGIGTLAASVTFGGQPSDNIWTAVDMRQATVDLVGYQATIICWSLEGY